VAQRIAMRAMQTTFGFSERRACGLVGADLELAHTLIISDDGAVLQTSFYSRNQIWTEQSVIARTASANCVLSIIGWPLALSRCGAARTPRGAALVALRAPLTPRATLAERRQPPCVDGSER
jgi:hypothetical protein